MKRVAVCVFALAAVAASVVRGENASDGDFSFLHVGVYDPVQIPVPWAMYSEKSSSWGEYGAYGLDVAAPCSKFVRAYGVQTGIFSDCLETCRGVQCSGLSRCGDGCGVQIGLGAIASRAWDGVQIGGCAWGGERVRGVQAGVFNCAQTANGAQIGLFNVGDGFCGLQIGLLNVSDDLFGLQIGLWNVIRRGTVRAMPIANMRF